MGILAQLKFARNKVAFELGPSGCGHHRAVRLQTQVRETPQDERQSRAKIAAAHFIGEGQLL